MLLLGYKQGISPHALGIKTMILRIKVSKLDFQAACSDSWVDGQLQGRQGMYIYAELGKEHEYISSTKDDPKTSYKIFQNCAVFIAKSQEQLENGEYEANFPNVTVIIYS